MPTRRTILACAPFALAGCLSRFESGEGDSEPGSDSGGSDQTSGWTTYRGDVAATGRADTTLSESFEVERLWGWDDPIATPPDHPRLARSTPGVVPTTDAVYATAADPEFAPVAVDRTDPGLRWTLDDLTDARDGEYERTPTPVVADGDTFVHTSYRLWRIDDGNPVWAQDTGLWVGDELIGDRSELYTTTAVARIDPEGGETIDTERARESGSTAGLAVGSDGAVQALRVGDTPDGLLVGYDERWNVDWEIELPGQPPRRAPALWDGTAIVVAGGETIGVDIADGELRWRTDDRGFRSGVAVDGEGTVYAPHGTDVLVALDGPDGTRQWSSEVDRPLEAFVGDQQHVFPPIVANDAVVLGGPGGLAIFDRVSGTLRWHENLALAGAPAVAFGDVYTITEAGVITIRGQ